MSIKQKILNALEARNAGAPLRIAGSFTRHRARIGGLLNPFHVPVKIVENGDAHFIAYPGSYLWQAAGARGGLKLDANAYEPEITFLIRKLIRNSDIVLDIGANVGLHTVAFARAAGDGHVYAFEPVQEMAERLSQNCALNRAENVTLVPCALGADTATLDMAVNIAGQGLEGTSSLTDSFHIAEHPENYETRKVPVRRLDDIVGELDINGRIAFIKIDTEGFETFVLQGARQTLEKHRPAMIVEAHSKRLESAGLSFEWYLETFPDYQIFIIPAIDRTNPFLRLIPLSGDQPEIAVNLLFLPRPRRFDIT